MASTTNAAVIFGILVFLQVSCAVSRHPAEGKFELRQNVLAVMTVNSFEEGEGAGRPASCAGGARCGKMIRIVDTSNLGMNAKVVDECAGCDNEVGTSSHIWKNFNLDPSQDLGADATALGAAMKKVLEEDERPWTCCDDTHCLRVIPRACLCRDTVAQCARACQHCDEVSPGRYVCVDIHEGWPGPKCTHDDEVDVAGAGN